MEDKILNDNKKPKNKIEYVKLNNEKKKVLKTNDNDVLLEIEVTNEKGIKTKFQQWYSLNTVEVINDKNGD